MTNILTTHEVIDDGVDSTIEVAEPMRNERQARPELARQHIRIPGEKEIIKLN